MVRVCESLSKLHEYISPSELMLPSSTLTLEEDLKVLNSFDGDFALCSWKLSSFFTAENYTPYVLRTYFKI